VKKRNLVPPPLNPLPQGEGRCLGASFCLEHLNFEHLILFRISCFEFIGLQYLLCLWIFQSFPCQSLRLLGHHVILDFHQAMHWNLILDSRVKDAQTEEETAAEEEDAGGKDQHRTSREEGCDILEDDGKDETQQNNPSPEHQFHLPE